MPLTEGVVADCLKCSCTTDEVSLCTGFFYKLSVHLAGFGFLTLFRAGEGEGGGKKEWHPTLITSFPIQVDSLATTFPNRQWLRSSLYL